MNKIASWISKRGSDWTAESAMISSNGALGRSINSDWFVHQDCNRPSLANESKLVKFKLEKLSCTNCLHRCRTKTCIFKLVQLESWYDNVTENLTFRFLDVVTALDSTNQASKSRLIFKYNPSKIRFKPLRRNLLLVLLFVLGDLRLLSGHFICLVTWNDNWIEKFSLEMWSSEKERIRPFSMREWTWHWGSTLTCTFIVPLVIYPVANPWFPRGGGANPKGGANLLFGQFSMKTAWKCRNFGPGGGRLPSPSRIRHCYRGVIQVNTVSEDKKLVSKLVSFCIWNNDSTNIFCESVRRNIGNF